MKKLTNPTLKSDYALKISVIFILLSFSLNAQTNSILSQLNIIETNLNSAQKRAMTN